MVELQPAIPMLRVFDEGLARRFYEGFLGFGWEWESRSAPTDPLYAQVSRSGLRIHLTAHFGDGTPGTHLFLPVTGLDELHAELAEQTASFSRPTIETVPWGRVMTVVDPFANHLNFTDWRLGDQ